MGTGEYNDPVRSRFGKPRRFAGLFLEFAELVSDSPLSQNTCIHVFVLGRCRLPITRDPFSPANALFCRGKTTISFGHYAPSGHYAVAGKWSRIDRNRRACGSWRVVIPSEGKPGGNLRTRNHCCRAALEASRHASKRRTISVIF